MIISKLRGGLGNQMFQYAFGKKLALAAGTDLKLDHAWFHGPGALDPRREYNLDMFVLSAPRASRLEVILTKLFGTRITDEKTTSSAPQRAYADGFWQHYEYVQAIESQVRADFKFAQPINPVSQELAKRIDGCQSVCLQVRRTDFLNFGAFVGVEYYRAAVAEILRTTPGATFFIFSDDDAWCVENLTWIKGAAIVGPEHSGAQFANKFQLMTRCKHFIIPNSTFGWWAAFLSSSPTKRVIVSGRLQKALILPEWTVIQ